MQSTVIQRAHYQTAVDAWSEQHMTLQACECRNDVPRLCRRRLRPAGARRCILYRGHARRHPRWALNHALWVTKHFHPVLQDALTESTDTKQSQREIDGQTYFDYEIFSPVWFYSYLLMGSSACAA
jgi:hypothetical protein